MDGSRKSVYQDLIRIEINLLKPHIRELVKDDDTYYKVMFQISTLQPQIVDRLLLAQNYLFSNNSEEVSVEPSNSFDENILVPYYGTQTPLNQVSNITYEGTEIIIQPYEKNILKVITSQLQLLGPIVDFENCKIVINKS